MKLLGLIVQNKKGVNIVSIPSNSVSQKLINYYGKIIFKYVIKQFRKNQILFEAKKTQSQKK